ncbi:Isochorismatase-like protein [Mycena latifolia]|nr:Isochorismatase-like protein [Mycena latifolia]
MSPSSPLLIPGLPSTALIVIDVQQAFHDPSYVGRRSTPNLEGNLTSLLAAFRAKRLPVIHVLHVNTKNTESLWYEATRPDNVRPQACVAPVDGEPVLRKYNLSSGFGARVDGTGESLADVLAAAGVKTVILVGISSAHCVNSTARSAADHGLGVVMVSDATATHAVDVVEFGGAAGDAGGGKMWSAETFHAVALAQLEGEFADVVTTAEGWMILESSRDLSHEYMYMDPPRQVIFLVKLDHALQWLERFNVDVMVIGLACISAVGGKSYVGFTIESRRESHAGMRGTHVSSRRNSISGISRREPQMSRDFKKIKACGLAQAVPNR